MIQLVNSLQQNALADPIADQSGVRRWLRHSAILLLALTVAFTGIAADRDTFPAPPTLAVIGDVHGDVEALAAVLKMAGLTNEKGGWAGGKARLVQIGDLPDRAPDTRKVIQLLQDLEKQARRAGGAVHVLIGNHDAMNMYGDLRYVLPAEFAAFAGSGSETTRREYFDRLVEQQKPADLAAFRAKFEKETPLGWVEHRRAWSSEGEIGRWTASHPAVLKIGDTLFVHAGLSPKYAVMKMDDINSRVRTELNDFSKLQGGVTMDEEGPLWWRGFAQGSETELAPHVDAVLASFGVARVVIGHTPGREVTARFGGKVINVDVGLSRAYGSNRDCLIMENGQLFHFVQGQKTPLAR